GALSPPRQPATVSITVVMNNRAHDRRAPPSQVGTTIYAGLEGEGGAEPAADPHRGRALVPGERHPRDRGRLDQPPGRRHPRRLLQSVRIEGGARGGGDPPRP